MKNTFSRAALGWLALSALSLITACGSGNNLDVPSAGVALVPGTGVPVAATLDSQAAFDFVSSVVAKGEADTEDPIVLGDAVLAFSDIADPVTIIAA